MRDKDQRGQAGKTASGEGGACIGHFSGENGSQAGSHRPGPLA